MHVNKTKPFRFNDKRLADRLEAEVADLHDRLRFESDRQRRDTLDEIDQIERTLCQMHC